MVTLLAAAGCGDDDDSGDDASDTTTTTVEVPEGIVVGTGINDPEDPTIAVLQFMPAEVAVDIGTPVTWEWNGTEPHSVTFLAPGQTLPDPGSDPSLFAPSPEGGPTGPYDGTSMVNTGLQPLGPDAPAPFSMSFSKAGSYPFYCVIHPQMVGTVTVSEPGGTPDTPAEVAQRRAADEAKWLAEGRAAAEALAETKPTGTKNADGSTTWTVQMGGGSAHTDVLAFAPSPTRVKAGDTVTFVNNSSAPHTASFFGAGSEPIVDPTDPRTDVAAPGPSPQTLSPQGFFNTGLLPPNAPPGAGPPEAVRSYSYKIGTAGEYGYICILHSPSGMTGTITAT